MAPKVNMPEMVKSAPWLPERMVDVFTGDRGRPRPASALVTQLLRLVEHAETLYEEIREAMPALFAAEALPINTWLVSKVEDCLGATKRAVKGAERLKSIGIVEKSRLPLKADRDDLIGLRNLIEHTESEIIKGHGSRMLLGTPAMLRLGVDDVQLGDAQLTWTQLHSIIVALSDASRNLRK